MDVTEWQNRLEDTFCDGDVVAQALVPGLNQENAYQDHVVGKYHGHSLISDCFFCFYLDTLAATAQIRQRGGPPEEQPSYSRLFLSHITNFRSLRAAERAYLGGYPLDGFSLLRDLKDRAVFLAAIAAGVTTAEALWAAGRWENYGPDVTIERVKSFQSKCMHEERRVLKLMLGEQSGLSSTAREEFERLQFLFNFEVHGSMLTMTRVFAQIKNEDGFTAWPVADEDQEAMYMNTAWEVGWMLLRTLPMLQLAPRAFGSEWAHKWGVLDESFRHGVEELGKLGKQIGYAVIELIDTKFPFAPDNCSTLDAAGQARRRGTWGST